MRILLINIDSVIPNLALKKIERYHLDRGDGVAWNLRTEFDKWASDKIYVSCVFTKNKYLCEEWEGIADIGGTGYDIYKKLPPEIAAVQPKINWGFTTRGCIRKCKFCFVPEKEGKIHVVGDIYNIWDGESKDIVIMDNNILALPDHFKMICEQIRKEKLVVDFNQGLDIRLVTDDLAKEIKSVRKPIGKNVKFAFDSPKLKPILEKKIPILNKYKIRGMFYILVGFDSTFKEELSRAEYLVAQGQRPYIMRHEKCKGNKKYIALARWANSPIFGKGTIPFYDYLNNSDDGRRYRKYFNKQ